MELQQLAFYGLLLILGAGSVWLMASGNLLLGIVFLAVFIFFAVQIWKQKTTPQRLTKEELIMRASQQLEDKYGISILVDGKPILYDDVDLGEKWRFGFKVPDDESPAGWQFLPVTVDTYTGALGEKAGVRWKGINKMENFLNKDVGIEKGQTLTPEQLAQLRDLAGDVIDERIEAAQLRRTGEDYDEQ